MVLERTRNEALSYAWGTDSVQSQLDGISRNKTVYQQVASMLSHDHNWALCMYELSRVKFLVFLVQTPVSKWIEVWDRCRSNPDQVRTGLYSDTSGVKWIRAKSSSADHPCLDLYVTAKANFGGHRTTSLQELVPVLVSVGAKAIPRRTIYLCHDGILKPHASLKPFAIEGFNSRYRWLAERQRNYRRPSFKCVVKWLCPGFYSRLRT